MTDKELLELAAKAAGIEIEENGLHWNFTQDPAELREWNPLTDDGDALRLAVKTGVMRGCGFDDAWNAMFAVGKLPTDPYAATRRAITSAAAEIGKEMK